MSKQRLYKDMISNPRMWQLYIAIEDRGLDIMIYNPLEEHSLMTAYLDFEGDFSSKAVEDAIYDNPLLLNDFNRVTVVMRNNHFTLLPDDVTTDPALTETICSELTGRTDSEVLLDRLPLLDMSVAFAPDQDLLNFLRRTFPGVSVRHRISGLIQYWHATSRPMRPLTTLINLRENSIDIASYSANTLQFANTFSADTMADRLYYIMAVRESLGADSETPAVISGDRRLRDELTGPISRYVSRVLPAVFPVAMFKAGGQAAMNTPLDLVVLPLCE
ncbi:MAG: DUF3822 family protein [Bacteroidales bacterium]|nr:DUF3822 family protein [Bacteroidales bacterium]MDE6802111.1 DUF3822 family protein [Muribaculaceae bacterium]